MKKSIVTALTVILLQFIIIDKVFAQDNSTLKDTTAKKAPVKDRRVFEVFDEEPKFKGGDEATFIRNNLHYPKEALDNGIEGMVVVSVIIEIDGKISDIHVLGKVPGGGCTEETIRVIKLMNGKWEPGKVNGKPVNSRKIFSIKFTYPDPPKPKN